MNWTEIVPGTVGEIDADGCLSPDGSRMFAWRYSTTYSDWRIASFDVDGDTVTLDDESFRDAPALWFAADNTHFWYVTVSGSTASFYTLPIGGPGGTGTHQGDYTWSVTADSFYSELFALPGGGVVFLTQAGMKLKKVTAGVGVTELAAAVGGGDYINPRRGCLEDGTALWFQGRCTGATCDGSGGGGVSRFMRYDLTSGTFAASGGYTYDGVATGMVPGDEPRTAWLYGEYAFGPPPPLGWTKFVYTPGSGTLTESTVIDDGESGAFVGGQLNNNGPMWLVSSNGGTRRYALNYGDPHGSVFYWGPATPSGCTTFAIAYTEQEDDLREEFKSRVAVLTNDGADPAAWTPTYHTVRTGQYYVSPYDAENDQIGLDPVNGKAALIERHDYPGGGVKDYGRLHVLDVASGDVTAGPDTVDITGSSWAWEDLLGPGFLGLQYSSDGRFVSTFESGNQVVYNTATGEVVGTAQSLFNDNTPQDEMYCVANWREGADGRWYATWDYWDYNGSNPYPLIMSQAVPSAADWQVEVTRATPWQNGPWQIISAEGENGGPTARLLLVFGITGGTEYRYSDDGGVSWVTNTSADGIVATNQFDNIDPRHWGKYDAWFFTRTLNSGKNLAYITDPTDPATAVSFTTPYRPFGIECTGDYMAVCYQTGTGSAVRAKVAIFTTLAEVTTWTPVYDLEFPTTYPIPRTYYYWFLHGSPIRGAPLCWGGGGFLWHVGRLVRT